MTEHEPQYPRYEELYGFGESGLVRRVDIRNFRSIRHAKVELGRFTVLAGANGAGKSNVVDVFRFVSEALSLGLYAALERRAGIQAVRHRNPDESQKASTLSLEFNLWFNNGITADYRFALTSDLRGAFAVSSEEVEMWSASGDLFGSLKFKDGEMTEKPFLLVSDSPWQQENIAEFYLPQSVHVNVESLALPVVASGIGFYEVLSALREMRAYSIVPDLLREPQDSDEGRVLRVDGRNASSVWRDLDAGDRKELIGLLGHAVPGIVNVRTQRYGRKRGFEFHQEAGVGQNNFEGHQMSDGTLRLFGILLALLQPRHSSVIAIEEPEASLHVAALEALVGMMRERVPSGQLLLTTHSPELIDFVSPEELRVVRREEGQTVVEPLAAHTKDVVRDELFTLGELHRAGGLRGDNESSTEPTQ